MHNIKLVIAYDGQAYLGWQKTHTGPSIESVLQKVIEQIVQHPIRLQAASRTDAGVHAQGQVVNFLTPKMIDFNKFRTSLNSLLPKDIVVLDVKQMPLSFHPTLNCISKEYRYFICSGATQLPQHRFYSWHVPQFLNMSDIYQALPLLTQIHDFKSFCNVKKNANYPHYIREIHFLELLEIEEKRLCFRVGGNSFLYKMVRNIVGTLIDIGRGKIKLAMLPHILQSRYRPNIGMTAPALGLFLYKVAYREE